MKHKVGNKVKVRTDLIEGRDYGTETYYNEMEEFKGKVLTIEEVIGEEYIVVEDNSTEEDGGKWRFTDEMFEEE